MPHPTRRPRKTIEDYLALPDDVRAELIDGELLVTPAPSFDHQDVAFAICSLLKAHVAERDGGRVGIAPLDVLLPGGHVIQPDVLFVRRERLAIIERRVHGAPDLVVEVVSPSNADRDRFLKRSLYAAAGVPEYWIVDLEDRSVQVLELEGEAYREAGWYQAGASFTSQTLPALELDVASFFQDLP